VARSHFGPWRGHTSYRYRMDALPGNFSVLVGGARSAPKGRRRRPKGAAQRREAPPEAAKQGREKRAIFKSGLFPDFQFSAP